MRWPCSRRQLRIFCSLDLSSQANLEPINDPPCTVAPSEEGSDARALHVCPDSVVVSRASLGDPIFVAG